MTAKQDYTVKQDADGFFYSYTRIAGIDQRHNDEGWPTLRLAAYNLMNQIEDGSMRGGSITFRD